jgi:hypothetical protein
MAEGTKYNLGEFGILEVAKDHRGIIHGIVDKKIEAYVFKGRTLKEFERNMVKVLRENNESELAKMIDEKGLYKTAQHYKNLQSKTEEVGK